MKLIEHRIVVPTQCTPVSIYTFACVHKDNAGHSSEHWRAFLQDVAANPHAIAIGLGDYYDWLRSHAREFLSLYKADGSGARRQHSFDRLHDWRREAAQQFAEELRPIRDKIALMSLGNHHHEFPDGTNDVQEMCRVLKVPYGGHGGFLRLSIKTPTQHCHLTLNILYHHGERIGGGSTLGGDINAMAKKAQGWDFDVLIVAHNHQKHGSHIPVMSVNKHGTMRLVEKPRAFIRAGCFMRGYVEDCVTYAESAGLMNPTALGYVRLDILPKKPHGDTVRYDFKTYY